MQRCKHESVIWLLQVSEVIFASDQEQIEAAELGIILMYKNDYVSNCVLKTTRFEGRLYDYEYICSSTQAL